MTGEDGSSPSHFGFRSFDKATALSTAILVLLGVSSLSKVAILIFSPPAHDLLPLSHLEMVAYLQTLFQFQVSQAVF